MYGYLYWYLDHWYKYLYPMFLYWYVSVECLIQVCCDLQTGLMSH